jgi:hypothetical protein
MVQRHIQWSETTDRKLAPMSHAQRTNAARPHTWRRGTGTWARLAAAYRANQHIQCLIVIHPRLKAILIDIYCT